MTDQARDQQEQRFLFLHAQTALHPGSGSALGVVDLPVQRERHTQWPVVPGSTLKGILRDMCRERIKDQHPAEERDGQVVRTSRRVANEEDKELLAVFGPGKVEPDSGHAGALSVTDARILAFPVRSLKGVFAWVTCRAVLERLMRDAQLVAGAALDLTCEAWPQAEQAVCASTSPLLVYDDKMVLEEFEFTRVGEAPRICEWASTRAAQDPFTQSRLRDCLVILHDDDFTHFARHATEVTARIGLNYESKTTTKGALFYQEFLPPETLFYALVFATASRGGAAKSASDVMAYLSGHMSSVLQIGSDETVGKGLCAARLSGVEGATV